MYLLLSLDQLLASAEDQQRLQAVLSSVGSKSTILTVIQEAKAQSEVSEMQKSQGGMNQQGLSEEQAHTS